MQARIQAAQYSLDLHTLGWKAFQDLCAQICEEKLQQIISIYREAQDGGQDAVFLTSNSENKVIKTGTVQCKFTSKANRRLRSSDINSEMESIKELIENDQADTYILMTNMGVDAPIARELREKLLTLGVRKPHILGYEYITRVIRNSPRLRALVPRVYGLGDLSVILDERKAEQTKALLGHLTDTLKVYVPTEPHRKAVQKLSEYGIVLLLGDPAMGKSTIAAILATTSLEEEGHESFKCEGPIDLLQHWNPHEKGRLYWVDDAFGATQAQNDFIDKWISIAGQVQTAVKSGNRFVLTSRRHIYEAAKPKLGTRNFKVFDTYEAIVDVGELSYEERSQILYNHIKAGNQLITWKKAVKPFLDEVAAEETFTPEIARRLADTMFTKKVETSRAAILAFVREPKVHLIQIIDELSRVHQAALALVYIHRNRLPSMILNETWGFVANVYGVDVRSLGDALYELKNSFVVSLYENNNSYWTFKHPTIIDAISELMSNRPELTNLYLRGANWKNIVQDVVCEGITQRRDAIVITDSLMDSLVERLCEIPDNFYANEALFRFLHYKASDKAIIMLLEKEPALFNRDCDRLWWGLKYDSKFCTMARANIFGLLTDYQRKHATEQIENNFFDFLDSSFLNDETFLKLFHPIALLQLTLKLRIFLDDLIDKINEIELNVDEDEDPEAAFENCKNAIINLKNLFHGDKEALEKLNAAESAMEETIRSLNERVRVADTQWAGSDLQPSTPRTNSFYTRSIYSDVDE